MTGTDANITTHSDARIATTADEVVAAWSLVHDRFVDQGLIAPDPVGLVAPRQALGATTIVVYVPAPDGSVLSTVTGVGDHQGGVPADSVYHRELEDLRGAGGLLLEACLTASRTSSVALLIDKLRFVWWFAQAMEATHILFTAHPRDVEIYCRLVGFTRFGRETVYPDRNNAPVALAVLGVDEVRQLNRLPHAIRTFLARPIPAETFECRYRFPVSDRWRFAA